MSDEQPSRKLSKDQARLFMLDYLQNPDSTFGVCPYKLRVVMEDGRNTLLPVEVNELDRTLRILNDAAVTSYITGLTKTFRQKCDKKYLGQNNINAEMCASAVEGVRKQWFHSPKSFLEGKIKAFAFKDEPGYAFSRCKFNVVDYYQDSPTFNTLMANFSNADAIMAFIGSLFFEESYSQQYLWIHGGGGNGKGSLLQTIEDVFGNAFHSSSYVPINKLGDTDKFWTYEIIGKRIVIFPDCMEPGFVQSGLFKSLTGGDTIRVEQKGKQAYSVKMKAKFIFTSNKLPSISSSEADERRIILCRAKNIEAFTPDPQFKIYLAKEVPQFISNCILKYKAACPKHGPIPHNRNELDELIMENESYVHDFIDQHLEISAEISDYLPAKELRQLLLIQGKHIKPVQFYNILKKNFGIQPGGIQKKIEGKNMKVYAHMRIKK